MANCPADDAALHVTTAVGSGQHTIARQEGGSADMVGYHEQALVVQVGATGLARSSLDEDQQLVVEDQELAG